MDGADYTKAARILPHNIEAEQALLGAILIDNRALDRVSTLQGWHFHDPLHAKIYDALTHVIQSGNVATPITVKPFFDL
jgi:replicative DNA helicase